METHQIRIDAVVTKADINTANTVLVRRATVAFRHWQRAVGLLMLAVLLPLGFMNCSLGTVLAAMIGFLIGVVYVNALFLSGAAYVNKRLDGSLFGPATFLFEPAGMTTTRGGTITRVEWRVIGGILVHPRFVCLKDGALGGWCIPTAAFADQHAITGLIAFAQGQNPALTVERAT